MTSAVPDADDAHRAPSAAQRFCIVIAMPALLACSGCATIMSGTSERIRFDSRPPGAQVLVDGKLYTTPAEVTLSRSKLHEVEFVLPGHVPARRQVVRGDNGWVWGNIFVGGVVGMIVDYSSGASGDLEPDLLVVELVPVEAPEKAPAVAAPPPPDPPPSP